MTKTKKLRKLRNKVDAHLLAFTDESYNDLIKEAVDLDASYSILWDAIQGDIADDVWKDVQNWEGE